MVSKLHKMVFSFVLNSWLLLWYSCHYYTSGHLAIITTAHIIHSWVNLIITFSSSIVLVRVHCCEKTLWPWQLLFFKILISLLFSVCEYTVDFFGPDEGIGSHCRLLCPVSHFPSSGLSSLASWSFPLCLGLFPPLSFHLIFRVV